MDGLYGAIVIKPSEETETPFHLISADRATQQAMRRAEADTQPLLIADYTQLPFEAFDKAQNDANVEVLCMDAIVVNGGVSPLSSSHESSFAYSCHRARSIVSLGTCWTNLQTTLSGFL